MAKLTVYEAFLLLKQDGIYWAAGHEGRDRLITSVNSTEIPDCYEWFQKGEMILTTLYPYKTMDEKVKFIKNLRDMGVACLGVHPSKHETFDLPEYLKVIADSSNFPIFIINREVPYSKVMKKIYEYLLNKEQLALKKEKEINTAMLQILLSKGGIKEIIERLSKIVGMNVYLLDEDYQIVEKVNTRFDDKVFKHLRRDLQKRLAKNSERIRIIFYKPYTVMVLMININKYVKNYLILFGKLDLTCKNRELCKIALTSAATALKLDILNTIAIMETEQKLKHGFFDDVMSGHYNNKFLQKRADVLGLNVFEINFVVIIDFNFLSELDKSIYKRIENLVNVSFEHIKNRIIFSVKRSDEWIFLVGFKKTECREDKIYRKIMDSTLKNIQDQFNAETLPVCTHIGVSSGITEVIKLKSGYEEAKFAIETGKKIFDHRNITYYDDLGVYKFISIPDKLEDILKDDAIRNIYEYDKNKNGNLLETLEKYLDYNGSIKDTAESLYVHPNTIKYRIKRIKEITGKDLFINEQKKLYYHILVKALKML